MPKTEYREYKCDGLWYAEQSTDHARRESDRGYPTREELVASLAFGTHRWMGWEDK